MSSPEGRKPTPAWKIALIPVLLIGLVWNLMRDTDTVPEVVAGDQPGARVASGPDRVPSVQDVLVQLERTRQAEQARSTLPLEKVLKHDPFALSGRLAEQSGLTSVVESVASSSPRMPGKPQTTASAPRTRVLKNVVKALLNGPRGPAALVDSRIVRVGDFLEPDVRVVAIQADAIVVELTGRVSKAM